MRNEKKINNMENTPEVEYENYREKLLSSFTPVAELEKICMTLAHLPSKKAQDLLAMFKKSDQGHRVKWIDMAIDEGQFLYLSPESRDEERDYLSLKVVQEMWDEIVNLEIELRDTQLQVDKTNIEDEAIRSLIKKGEIKENERIILDEVRMIFEKKAKQLHAQVDLKEKIMNQIKKSIKTERYREIDPWEMRNTHFS